MTTKDCKTVRCYNEIPTDQQYCHDCFNRQREDKAKTQTSLLESITNGDDEAVKDWNERAESGEIMRII